MTYWKIETYHPAIQAQVYRDILDQDSMKLLRKQHIPRADNPPMNEAQVYRALLDQHSRAIEKSTHTQGRQTPTNQAQVYRALLHMDSIMYWEIETYQGQIVLPANWEQVYREILHQYSMSYWEINTYPGQDRPPWIKHKSTEPY